MRSRVLDCGRWHADRQRGVHARWPAARDRPGGRASLGSAGEDLDALVRDVSRERACRARTGASCCCSAPKLRPGGAVGTASFTTWKRAFDVALLHGNRVTSVGWPPPGTGRDRQPRRHRACRAGGRRRAASADGPRVDGLGCRASIPRPLDCLSRRRWHGAAVADAGRTAVSHAAARGIARSSPHAHQLPRGRGSVAPSGYRLDFEPFTGWKRQPPRW